MFHPLIGMSFVLAIFGALFVVLRWYQLRYEPHPEIPRKLMHLGMGLIAMGLPWLFVEAWPVLALAALSIAALIALRIVPNWRQRMGGVVCGVSRRSLGEIYFAISAAALFLLARGDAILFCLPMLILTLADAAGALIGIRYGALRFSTPDGQKSAEGSVAFFVVAFFSAHVPLLLATDVGRTESVLIATTLGLVAMLIEAIAWRGLDNLFIPLGAFALLKNYLVMDVATLSWRLIVTLLLVTFVLVWSRRATLTDSALIGGALIGYACWALGGWRWLLAPLTLFVTYTLLSPRTPQNSRRVHNLYALLGVTGSGLVWLILTKFLGRAELLYPFTLSFAIHLAIVGVTRLKNDYPDASSGAILAKCAGKGWLLMFLPFPFSAGLSQRALLLALGSVAMVTASTLAFDCLQPQMRDCPIDLPRWLRQAGVATAGSALGLIPLYWR
jgi:phytol kinase